MVNGPRGETPREQRAAGKAKLDPPSGRRPFRATLLLNRKNRLSSSHSTLQIAKNRFNSYSYSETLPS